MGSLEEQATFENVESKFKFTRCIHQGCVEAPTLWLKLAKHMRKECGESQMQSPERVIRSHRAMALTSVMTRHAFYCVWKKAREPEGW